MRKNVFSGAILLALTCSTSIFPMDVKIKVIHGCGFWSQINHLPIGAALQVKNSDRSVHNGIINESISCTSNNDEAWDESWPNWAVCIRFPSFILGDIGEHNFTPTNRFPLQKISADSFNQSINGFSRNTSGEPWGIGRFRLWVSPRNHLCDKRHINGWGSSDIIECIFYDEIPTIDIASERAFGLHIERDPGTLFGFHKFSLPLRNFGLLVHNSGLPVVDTHLEKTDHDKGEKKCQFQFTTPIQPILLGCGVAIPVGVFVFAGAWWLVIVARRRGFLRTATAIAACSGAASLISMLAVFVTLADIASASHGSYCVPSHASNTATISDISQSLGVTSAVIAGVTFKV